MSDYSKFVESSPCVNTILPNFLSAVKDLTVTDVEIAGIKNKNSRNRLTYKNLAALYQIPEAIRERYDAMMSYDLISVLYDDNYQIYPVASAEVMPVVDDSEQRQRVYNLSCIPNHVKQVELWFVDKPTIGTTLINSLDKSEKKIKDTSLQIGYSTKDGDKNGEVDKVEGARQFLSAVNKGLYCNLCDLDSNLVRNEDGKKRESNLPYYRNAAAFTHISVDFNPDRKLMGNVADLSNVCKYIMANNPLSTQVSGIISTDISPLHHINSIDGRLLGYPYIPYAACLAGMPDISYDHLNVFVARLPSLLMSIEEKLHKYLSGTVVVENVVQYGSEFNESNTELEPKPTILKVKRGKLAVYDDNTLEMISSYTISSDEVDYSGETESVIGTDMEIPSRNVFAEFSFWAPACIENFPRPGESTETGVADTLVNNVMYECHSYVDKYGYMLSTVLDANSKAYIKTNYVGYPPALPQAPDIKGLVDAKFHMNGIRFETSLKNETTAKITDAITRFVDSGNVPFHAPSRKYKDMISKYHVLCGIETDYSIGDELSSMCRAECDSYDTMDDADRLACTKINDLLDKNAEIFHDKLSVELLLESVETVRKNIEKYIQDLIDLCVNSFLAEDKSTEISCVFSLDNMASHIMYTDNGIKLYDNAGNEIEPIEIDSQMMYPSYKWITKVGTLLQLGIGRLNIYRHVNFSTATVWKPSHLGIEHNMPV